MATINFKHLRYFWAIAKSGSIARASAQLHVTPQSISSQLAELEEALGTGLFRRVGRGLEMTDIVGRVFKLRERDCQLGKRTILLRADSPGDTVCFQNLVVLSNQVVLKKGKASERSHQDDGTSPGYDLLIRNRKPVNFEFLAFAYPRFHLNGR